MPEFARAGFEALHDVTLEAGPLNNFPHNMEPYLRKLGLPTKLDQGMEPIFAENVVCRAGMPLSSDQAKLLQLLRRAGKLADAPKYLKQAERASPCAALEPGYRYCEGLLARCAGGRAPTHMHTHKYIHTHK